MANSNSSCDLCGNKSLEAAYTPDNSGRGLTVFVCRSCGLVQSLPRRDRAPRRSATISSGADWGNLRYGKGFRVSRHMEWLKEIDRIPEAPVILDVGANRGAFLDAALLHWPNANVTAIEPDSRVTGPYRARDQVTLIPERIEDTNLPDTTYDLVYSSHTLEHILSPLDALRDHARTLKDDGLLLLEVPNIALIAGDDIVEEWFIDKHLYHFSNATLRLAAHIAGFEVLRVSPETERSHITMLLKPFRKQREAAVPSRAEGERSSVLLQRYQAIRKRNRANLALVANALQAREGEVAIWGAGRIFDSLVRYGNLDVSCIRTLIDKNLTAHTADRHGVKLCTPDALKQLEPATIFIASRDFAEEIAAEARELSPTSEILTYAQALQNALHSSKTTKQNEARI